jgi:hypothetical protein
MIPNRACKKFVLFYYHELAAEQHFTDYYIGKKLWNTMHQYNSEGDREGLWTVDQLETQEMVWMEFDPACAMIDWYCLIDDAEDFGDIYNDACHQQLDIQFWESNFQNPNALIMDGFFDFLNYPLVILRILITCWFLLSYFNFYNKSEQYKSTIFTNLRANIAKNKLVIILASQWYWSYEYSDYISKISTCIGFNSYMIPTEEFTFGNNRLLTVDNRDFSPP